MTNDESVMQYEMASAHFYKQSTPVMTTKTMTVMMIIKKMTMMTTMMNDDNNDDNNDADDNDKEFWTCRPGRLGEEGLV
jgi:hypothetical protein